MTWRAVFYLVPALLLSAAQPAIRRLDGSAITVIDAEAFAARTLHDAHVTGAQIVVVNRGRIAWSYAYGLRGRAPDLPMQKDTSIWAASITKSVFAAYVMQLVERGEFQLDVPVAAQLSQPLDAYEPYRDTASAIIHEPGWAALTPRMLLAHTGGLLNFASLEPDKKMHMHGEPGKVFRYSGEGINLLQFLVEQKMHRGLEDSMQQAMFLPLGMAHTGLIHRKEFEANVADRFDADEKFLAKTRRFPARAAGSMVSTAEDLARFATALLDGKLLRPETRAQMFQPVVAIRSQHQFSFRPEPGDSAEAAAVGLAYGLGWGLLTHTRYGAAFFKEGHGDGGQDYLICFERSASCMILLTNSDNGELAFRPLLETILGDTVTPWEWEGYTRSYIEKQRAVPQ